MNTLLQTLNLLLLCIVCLILYTSVNHSNRVPHKPDDRLHAEDATEVIRLLMNLDTRLADMENAIQLAARAQPQDIDTIIASFNENNDASATSAPDHRGSDVMTYSASDVPRHFQQQALLDTRAWIESAIGTNTLNIEALLSQQSFRDLSPQQSTELINELVSRANNREIALSDLLGS